MVFFLTFLLVCVCVGVGGGPNIYTIRNPIILTFVLLKSSSMYYKINEINSEKKNEKMVVHSNGD